ncbi:hypothetical protein GCM10025760_20770 [Microbacterium yannicii]|uniref:Alpha/beta hydrolase n=1 Tax=Microbacterium yannicii TaxID=671622 RepID=A0ABP9MA17_9MICO
MIDVPTVVLESGSDGVAGPSPAMDRGLFTGPHEQRFLEGIGHNVPQEDPASFGEAVLTLLH